MPHASAPAATFAAPPGKKRRNGKDINVSNLTVTFHGAPILEGTDFVLNWGNRYGFIGRNGSGKSTLMRCVGARAIPIPESIDIYHLTTEYPATEETALYAVMKVDAERAAVEREIDELNDAMAELAEQVHLEDPTLEAEEGAPEPEPVRPTSIAQAFQHFACLYIKYLQIFRKLERCYDGMVHPQKRLAVLKVLELVMQRVVELKHSLVKYSPPPPVVQQDKSFPWEYVNLDSVLVDLKLPPDTLEVPVPKYFREDSAEARKVRDKIVEGYMQVKHGVPEIPLESSDGAQDSGSIPLDKAIEIIQLNERGRQGKERATLVKVLREEEKRRKAYDAAHGGAELDQDVASIEIQRALRGLVARNRAVSYTHLTLPTKA